MFLRAKIILQLASLLTESGQYARPAPRCHHMGWDLTVAGVLAYLHLHILLLPWVAKWPQHHPQKSLHKPLHRRVAVPCRDQQGWSAGKKNARSLCNMQHVYIFTSDKKSVNCKMFINLLSLVISFARTCVRTVRFICAHCSQNNSKQKLIWVAKQKSVYPGQWNSTQINLFLWSGWFSKNPRHVRKSQTVKLHKPFQLMLTLADILLFLPKYTIDSAFPCQTIEL